MGAADLLLRRTQFLADHAAERGFNLLARHRLMERLIDKGLLTALPSLIQSPA